MTDKEVGRAALNAVSSIGNDKFEGIEESILEMARQKFRKAFGAKPEFKPGVNRSSFESNIWQALLEDAKDVEIDVTRWMREGCPSGIGASEI